MPNLNGAGVPPSEDQVMTSRHSKRVRKVRNVNPEIYFK